MAPCCFHETEACILHSSSASGLSLLHTGHFGYFNQWMTHTSTSDAAWTLGYSIGFKVHLLVPLCLLSIFLLTLNSHFFFTLPERIKKRLPCRFSSCVGSTFILNLSFGISALPNLTNTFRKERPLVVRESTNVISASWTPQNQNTPKSIHPSHTHPDFKRSYSAAASNSSRSHAVSRLLGMFLPFLPCSKLEKLTSDIITSDEWLCSLFSSAAALCDHRAFKHALIIRLPLPFTHTCTHWWRRGVFQHLWLAWKNQWVGTGAKRGVFFEMSVWVFFHPRPSTFIYSICATLQLCVLTPPSACAYLNDKCL